MDVKSRRISLLVVLQLGKPLVSPLFSPPVMVLFACVTATERCFEGQSLRAASSRRGLSETDGGLGCNRRWLEYYRRRFEGISGHATHNWSPCMTRQRTTKRGVASSHK